MTGPGSSTEARRADLLLTAIAPVVWGSTYIATTALLPGFPPMTVAMLRALPAGLLLLALVRELPAGIWWVRACVLGALNFSLFWSMLFVAAYRLPGGVAATIGAVQPLIVILLMPLLLAIPAGRRATVAAATGLGGVALLALTPQADLDPMGIAAALMGAASMACGTVLSRKWRPPVSLLTFTAWQLTAGGLLIAPFALALEPAMPAPSTLNLLGLLWLGAIGAALGYILWFRGIALLEPPLVSTLGFLSPMTAVLLGWVFLDQALTLLQTMGALLVIASSGSGTDLARAQMAA